MKEIVTDLEKLSERCDEIDTRKENNLMREIILELKDTLRNNPTGVGLAAPQIGYDKRIFVINFKGDIRTFINPIITQAKGLVVNREACLSLPGKEYVRPRNTEITVLYQTPLGKSESRKLVGLAAYVFQHELDHLDGITLADIGMELQEDFDKATQEEKDAIIEMYLDSLDIKRKDANKEIEKDEELRKMSSAIDFMEKVQTGKVEFGDTVTKEKPTDDSTAE